MTWILIVMVWSTIGSNPPNSLTSVKAYRTEAACQAAGVKAQADLNTKYIAVKFSCSRTE